MFNKIRSNHKLKKPLNVLFVISLVFMIMASAVEFFSDSVTPTTVSASNSAEIYNRLKKLTSYSVLDYQKKPLVNAKAYAIFDGQSGEFLLGVNETTKYPIASITKLATALTAKEIFPSNEVIEIRSFATKVSGSKLGLRPGEKYYFKDLLMALLVSSSNDAAYAIASHYQKADDISQFVERMNAWAKKHRLKDTYFTDPAGLSDDGGSTIMDIAKMARLALRDPEVQEMVKISETDVYSVDKTVSHHLKSTNSLLLPKSPYFSEDAIGVKTGFTYQAGYCLVSAFTFQERPFVLVVLNTVEFKSNSAAKESFILWQWAKPRLHILNY